MALTNCLMKRDDESEYESSSSQASEKSFYDKHENSELTDVIKDLDANEISKTILEKYSFNETNQTSSNWNCYCVSTCSNHDYKRELKYIVMIQIVYSCVWSLIFCV